MADRKYRPYLKLTDEQWATIGHYAFKHGTANATCHFGSLVFPCGLYQFMSNTEGKALLFGSKWLVCPAFSSPLAPTAHTTPLPRPIDSIRDITGAEKTI